MTDTKELTCLSCEHVCSFQGDGEVVCHVWCSETDRDFTFSGANTVPCELFKEEE
jgi:hypothetical protein